MGETGGIGGNDREERGSSEWRADSDSQEEAERWRDPEKVLVEIRFIDRRGSSADLQKEIPLSRAFASVMPSF